MIQEILLLTNFVIAIILTCKFNDKNYSFKESLNFLFVTNIFLPLIEESLFRCTLYNLTYDFYYYKELNALLFGLLHLFNYKYNYSFQITFYQSLLNIYFGYYLINLNNLKFAILIHIAYNFLLFIIYILYIRLIKYPIINKKKEITNEVTYIHYGQLYKSKSYNDLPKKLKMPINNINYREVNINKLPLDIKILIKQFDQIEKKSLEKLLKKTFKSS